MPIPDRRIFHLGNMHSRGVWGIRPSFPGLSPCPGQVAYVLLTSALALPLDLHVLSLSLAFILSQDQTLRCCIIVFSIFRIMKTQRRFVPCPGAASLPAGFVVLCLCCVLPVFRNLDVDSFGFPFLVSALSISSLQTFQRTMLSGTRHRQNKASKKSLTQFVIL